MRNILKRIIRRIRSRYLQYGIKHFERLPLKDAIVFESVPDLTDNTKAVFDECLKRKLNRHIKLIWFIYGDPKKTYEKYKNVLYVTPWSLEAQYYTKLAKVKVCCNQFLTKEREGQICIYLSHGTAIKDVRGFYAVPDGIDYFVTASENVMELQSEMFLFPKEKMIPLGFPRNDILGGKKRDISNLFNRKYNKIIAWYPTYRQHRGGRKTGVSNALPIISYLERANRLNDAAKQMGVLIVVKPHFAQDLTYIRDAELSNIKFIGDSFFENNSITSYEFVAVCDALISDYSSIYFDYTLCNKPIAAIWEDIEEYKSNPGLVENYEFLMKGAEKVYTLGDLIAFVQRVANNVDLLKTEREEIRDYANISSDSRNSERVVEFIGKKSKLF